ncbi:DNA ligase D [soil metagenome]
MTPERDPLTEYRAKRPAASPEPDVAPTELRAPGATAAETAGGAFVVQLHAARRLHYDLRLEMNGVLKSWAVPKGPALDPAEKRLAVHVEDHPLEYADFEGVIPAGGYGAGAMIVWDRGVWVPLADPEAGLAAGKLLFELRGHKLQGVWTLVRLKKSPKEWLLIRELRGSLPAAAARDAGDLPPESVYSGLTVQELADGHDPGPLLVRRLEGLGPPRRSLHPEEVRMMLATPQKEPFSRAGWIFELKLDGYRMLGGKSEAGVSLLTRNGHDATSRFPELMVALAALPYERFVLDGEIVAHDAAGRPSFQSLQKRARLSRRIDVDRAARRQPVTFYAFDLLAAGGFDLRPLALIERKQILRDFLPPVGPIRYVEHFEERGDELFERVQAMGLEGIVGKAADSRYGGGRSRDWIKVRADLTDDFVVVGYTRARGSRTGFGALHLAAFRSGLLTYAGRAGSGFADHDLATLRSALDKRHRATPPCVGDPPLGAEHHWVEPDLVCEVRYRERTADGLLRHPVFLRMRDDKKPEDCVLPPDPSAEEDEPPEDGTGLVLDPGRAAADISPADVHLSNPDKVFWPVEGYAKRDLFEYYRKVSPWLLPYLRDRPLVLTRYPDGIEGKSFYQKNAPGTIPDWVRTVGIHSESSERQIDYFLCDDLATLLYLVNLGTIPLHVWASRAGSLDAPDWCILDLDPKGSAFENVVDVARCIYRVCKEIEVPSFVKTSGSTGLHVLIPLGGRFGYEGSRMLGELLARVVVRERPTMATIERAIPAREGKVYVDYLQNRRGQLLVAPFSARPIPGAPVSTPLRWREVTPDLDIGRFTIETVPRRIARMAEDPVAPVLIEIPDLEPALERLRALVSEGKSGRGGRI